jgi:hypothetical protein
MKRMLCALVASLFLAAGASAAPDIKNGNAWIKAVKQDQFEIDGNPMGKNMLLGYLQDLKDTKHIEGVVLKNPDKATGDHKRLLKVIADYLQIGAYTADNGQLAPIAPAAPAEVAAPAPAEAAAPTPAEDAH